MQFTVNQIEKHIAEREKEILQALRGDEWLQRPENASYRSNAAGGHQELKRLRKWIEEQVESAARGMH